MQRDILTGQVYFQYTVKIDVLYGSTFVLFLDNFWTKNSIFCATTAHFCAIIAHLYTCKIDILNRTTVKHFIKAIRFALIDQL